MFKIIDADSHLFEQPGMWREHMPATESDLALDIEEDELGYSWLTHGGRRLLQCYISEPGRLWESYGLPHKRRRDGEMALVRYGDMPETYKDPEARLEALDDWGLDEQVLFPNWGLNFGWYLQGDSASERANIAAWNRWAAEVSASGRGRLRPVAHLTLRADSEWIRRELVTIAEAGIKQVFLGTGQYDTQRLSHPNFEPVWSQMVDLELTPTFHIGAFAERSIADGWQSNDAIQYMTLQSFLLNGLEAQIALGDLILNGVFDRHPTLTWIVTEYSVHWLPEFRIRLNAGYDVHYEVCGTHNVELALRPSDYVDRNVRLVSFPTEHPAEIMQSTANVLMFGGDFPHAEGLSEPLRDYTRIVGDLGQREAAFYGGTFSDAVG